MYDDNYRKTLDFLERHNQALDAIAASVQRLHRRQRRDVLVLCLIITVTVGSMATHIFQHW